MIIFLYGEDSFGLSRKTKEIIKGHKAKNPSGLNLAEFDFIEDKLEDFFDSAKSSSIIPEKKLLVLKNINKIDSEALLRFLKKQNFANREDVILLVISSSDSAHGELFKYLTKKPNQSQSFKPFKEYEVKIWVRQSADLLGIDLTSEAVDFLVTACGADLWRLDSEIKKLADYKIKGVVSKSQVEELAVASANYKIFELTDAIAKKDKKRALGALYKALDNDEKPTELLGLLAWQMRNVLRFKLNPEKSSSLKLHPFVLDKAKAAAKLFSIEELNALLSKIIALDLSFKTSNCDERVELSLLIAGL
ncbi:MAG: DNA polymerase III subunit delta [Candidatus Azambacteria bacterium]|nr:DNA polymerase III subunit delta [Candidatus Azambacteria bacterium]